MDNYEKLIKYVNKSIRLLEIIISIIIVLGIVLTLPDLVKYFYSLFISGAQESYYIFKDMLAHALLIIVGLEFVIMVTIHTDNSIIYLMIFLVARKMLVYSDTSWDMIIGVLTLLILFLIKKFLLDDKNESLGISIASIFGIKKAPDTVDKKTIPNEDMEK
jgi:hypothetical protein